MDSLKSTEKKVYLCVGGVRSIARKDRLCGRMVYSLGLTKGPLMLPCVEGTRKGRRRGGEKILIFVQGRNIFRREKQQQQQQDAGISRADRAGTKPYCTCHGGTGTGYYPDRKICIIPTLEQLRDKRILRRSRTFLNIFWSHFPSASLSHRRKTYSFNCSTKREHLFLTTNY